MLQSINSPASSAPSALPKTSLQAISDQYTEYLDILHTYIMNLESTLYRLSGPQPLEGGDAKGSKAPDPVGFIQNQFVNLDRFSALNYRLSAIDSQFNTLV